VALGFDNEQFNYLEVSMSNKKKSAIITGSSRGIGRAIAERLAADGVSVVINYARNSKQADEVVRRIIDRGGEAVAIQADVSKAADIRRLFDEAQKLNGSPDIVVANAGVFLRKPLADSTDEDFDNVFNTNTRGVFFTLREAARRVNENGRIVAVSTGGTRMAFADASLYLGSKGAVEQFVRSLSRELGPKFITVNVLSPGFTETDMLPQDSQLRSFGASLSPFNRIGTAEDVADVAAFLASEAAGWVTGQNIQAGGGVV
jgi:3-oxoacyl-[acyl-carrier protein] reductase